MHTAIMPRHGQSFYLRCSCAFLSHSIAACSFSASCNTIRELCKQNVYFVFISFHAPTCSCHRVSPLWYVVHFEPYHCNAVVHSLVRCRMHNRTKSTRQQSMSCACACLCECVSFKEMRIIFVTDYTTKTEMYKRLMFFYFGILLYFYCVALHARLARYLNCGCLCDWHRSVRR